MPAPITQNKYREQFENNIDLRSKMALAFAQALNALDSGSLGALDGFDITLDGIYMRYRTNEAIYINELTYFNCSPALRKQAYDRLEKFMKIAIERYNIQYNL